MSFRLFHNARTALTGFARQESGATLVEFAMVFGVFIFLIFGIIDFARFGFAHVMAEKATETAVRSAVVSPAICNGLPERNIRASDAILSSVYPNGTLCSTDGGICADPGTTTCRASMDDATSAAIWARVAPLLPNTAEIENLEFSYSYDPALGRLGAAYAPVVSAQLADLQFDFISPLGALAGFAAQSGDTGLGASFTFPGLSASLPAEDLR